MGSQRFENMDTVEIDSSIYGGDFDYGSGNAGVDSDGDRGDTFESAPDGEIEIEVAPHEDVTEAGGGEATGTDSTSEDATDDTESEVDPETAEVKDEGKPDRTKRNNMVPRDRLNKEIEARRALEARIAQLETGQKTTGEQPAAAPLLTPEMVTRMFDAALDGKNEDAVAALTDILSAHEQSVLEKARGLTNQEVEGRLYRERVNTELGKAATEVAESYPEFDPQCEHFDTGLADEVVAVRDTLIQRGHAPAEALRRAARFTATENGLEALAKGNPLANIEKPTAKPIDVSKKVEMANKQPSRLGGSGGRNAEPSLDVFKMNNKDFDSLSKEQLAQLRGDYL